jgi:putative ABC transport system ATP-binding protein
VTDDGLLLTSSGQHGGATAGTATAQPAPPTSGGPPTQVELERVSRSRGRGAARRTVIDDLSVRFQPGRLTVVTGRSGSGKTTLLEMLACLQRPDAGEVRLDGVSLRDADAEQLAEARRRRIGYLPQEPEPVGFLSAVENVALALQIRGARPDEAAATARAVLTRTGLADRSDQRVTRLSAGEAQRVALARALACAEGLLIADEPTSRLDTANAAAVARLLSEAARSGQTVICATHDPLLIEHADRIISLDGSPGGGRRPSQRPEEQPAH